MIQPENNSNYDNGFCYGTYPVSVDSGPRIRLKKGTVLLLQKNKVKQLWQYPDPTGPRFILCPLQFRSTYIETAKQNLPKSMDPEIALRKYIFSGQPVCIDSQGRIPILAACQEQLKVKGTDVVFVVGLGQWFEIWLEKDWVAGSGEAGTD
jgi:DNA-binding transcriptional regulator/RsmH inhibitor MraZ